MEAKRHRPLRWRRNHERQRASLRRMLAAGAFVGLVLGVAAQPFVHLLHVEGDELRGLVRLALLLPAGIFVAWWLLVPGMSLDADDPEVPERTPVDPDERLQQIEATFDTTAVPSVDSVRPERPADAVTEELRRSIRRPAASGDEAERFGIRRPASSTRGNDRAIEG